LPAEKCAWRIVEIIKELAEHIECPAGAWWMATPTDVDPGDRIYDMFFVVSATKVEAMMVINAGKLKTIELAASGSADEIHIMVGGALIPPNYDRSARLDVYNSIVSRL